MGRMNSLLRHLQSKSVDNQLSWKIDYFQSLKPNLVECTLMTLYMTINDVIVSLIFIHQVKESSLDAWAFLIDGIIKGIDQTIHSLLDFALLHSASHPFIDSQQFLTMVYEIFELNAFWMIQKKHIEGFVDGS